MGNEAPVVRVDWRIALGCAVALTLLFAAPSIPVLGGARQPLSVRLTNQGLNWGLWLVLMPLVFAIAARAHRRRITDWRAIAFQLAASFAVPVLHELGVAAARWSIGSASAPSFVYFFRVIIALAFPGDYLRYWLIAAVYHALRYNAEARLREVNEAKTAQRLAEARLATLEARLQPHFLFNALNAIAALIRKDPAAASLMVGQLSDLLRAALSAEATREVTLAGELALLDRYVAIQRVRFSDRLTFSVDATTEALGAYVPQMILQPIVENAIHHGIGPREAPGAVQLHAVRDRSMLRLIVRDDGVGYGSAPASLKGSGLGLRSTRARLAHFYGDGFGFDIRATNPVGTIVTIDLPFHTEGPLQPRSVIQ